jgi:hypothetical protein
MIQIYSAGRQLRKVRFMMYFSLICAAGCLWWGISLFQTYGLATGDGGVLAPLPLRLVYAPWQSLRFAGRRLPFLLDLQGEMLEPDLVEQLFIKPQLLEKAVDDHLNL